MKKKSMLYTKELSHEAMDGSDALIIITEWNQFRNLDLDRVKALLTQPYFFDLRNIYKRSAMEKQGVNYFGIGQGVGWEQIQRENMAISRSSRYEGRKMAGSSVLKGFDYEEHCRSVSKRLSTKRLQGNTIPLQNMPTRSTRRSSARIGHRNDPRSWY